VNSAAINMGVQVPLEKPVPILTLNYYGSWGSSSSWAFRFLEQLRVHPDNHLVMADIPRSKIRYE
jgi:hypothetical protein